MALGYWRNSGEDRQRIVVLDNGYHGDTIGTMSVGARGAFNRAYEPLLFDVTSIPFPGDGAEQATLDALEAACRRDAAAFIAEPLILGAGGMLVYSAQTLAEMRRICAQYGTLFIADEVMTGWGRTGSLLACEQAGIEPDILCLSKGLTGGAIPLAVTMASEPVYEAHLSTDRADMFFHSSSYTANPVACAAANANLAIWREEPVRERIALLARAAGSEAGRNRGAIRWFVAPASSARLPLSMWGLPRGICRISPRECWACSATATCCSVRSATRSTRCRHTASTRASWTRYTGLSARCWIASPRERARLVYPRATLSRSSAVIGYPASSMMRSIGLSPVVSICGNDGSHRRRLGMGARFLVAAEQREPFQIAAGGEDQLDLSRLRHVQCALCADPEQAGILGLVHFDVDCARAQIGEVETRVVNAGIFSFWGNQRANGVSCARSSDQLNSSSTGRKRLCLLQHSRGRRWPSARRCRPPARCEAGFLQRFANDRDLVRGFLRIDIGPESALPSAKSAGSTRPPGNTAIPPAKVICARSDRHQDFRRLSLRRRCGK